MTTSTITSAADSSYFWSGPSLIFGVGSTSRVGGELKKLNVRRALIVTDESIRVTGLADRVSQLLRQAGVEAEIWSGAETEPRERSISAAMDQLADESFDGYVGLGGGSSIDTCKMINLLKSKGGALLDYVSAPHGGAKPIDGPLAPMIGVPTTAGTGSECTAVAIVDLDGSHVKAAITAPSLRPTLAIIDPRNSLSCSPQVTASGGYDALIQALESYTSRPFDQPVPAGSVATNYAGFNPISKLWCEESIIKAATNLRRAYQDGTDLEARTEMSMAALFSRLGNAGVHIPHANAYGVAGEARNYVPDGFAATRSFVPHGQSVIVTAPAAFRFTFAGAQERHKRAAALLGVSSEEILDDPQGAIPRWLSALIRDTGGPTCLEELGLSSEDIPAMVERSMGQQRVLVCAPLKVGEADIENVFRETLRSQVQFQ